MALTTSQVQYYLQLPPILKNMPKRPFWMSYDPEADVMYINFHLPPKSATDTEVTDDDIVIRYESDEIIGLTILNVSQR